MTWVLLVDGSDFRVIDILGSVEEVPKSKLFALPCDFAIDLDLSFPLPLAYNAAFEVARQIKIFYCE